MSGNSGQQNRRTRNAKPENCSPTGHPARGRSRSRQVSWLTAQRFHPPSRLSPVAWGAKLAAYSCGGSSGIARPPWASAPDSRLSSRLVESKEPRTQDMVDEVNFPSTDR
ncbi:predicted protein [Brucella abortus bv. 4 str. 292]|uniref:Uncharacterized protein n=2 Tax=Brucella TaxID=234 RepID=A0ABM9Z8J2_9HYPH|nr:predicted protein [Brucella abortus bv. 4 str. 292]EEX60787.1 predicted protein [Brucella abortus bv. 2 str. 86/8/59]EEX84279.1 predicted protein [Brucella abortus bv. 3 str. Tulya]EEX88597.1 predicted protein [Brucella ceti M13/05/1]EEX95996.1 predicted protein [Brucella ceti M644/93/1]EEY01890.1 predicted protein [Brucella pinnipedialis B2/94]EEY06114.1 predicted protein [Brucella pinnipedialis M163/99/10]EEY30986.1 predicted protein [Brucella suis bv. 3 str. 686]